MSDERREWERLEGEPALWYRRFERYLMLFPRRSVAAIFAEEHLSKNPDKPRRNPDNDWYEAAKQWQWEKRAQAYDEARFAEDEKEAALVRRSGYALQHKRILALQEIVDGLMGHLNDKDKVWLPDVKSIGTGPDAERVDLVQFNDALFKEIREYLTDISEEMGERVKKKDVSLRTLPANVYIGFDPDQDGVE